MECPQCASENSDGHSFCSDCGALLTPRLLPVIRTQVEEYIKEHLKDQELVDVKTTEAIAARFVKWGKWFLIPATILITLLGLTLCLLGFRDFSDVRKAAQQAITESSEATKNATDAKAKAQDAEMKAAEAIKAIGAATTTMNLQLAKAQKLSENVSGAEQKTAAQFSDAGKQVERRLSELDREVQEAHKTIAEQQTKLLSTNELVTAMFSNSQVETFDTDKGNTSTFSVVPLHVLPTTQKAPPQAAVYMLLKGSPIYQTVQLNFRVYVQPKTSYFIAGNLVTFFWGESPENLKQWPLEVSYVPDPTYHGRIYKAISVHDGHLVFDQPETH
jgi:hypothetical protein